MSELGELAFQVPKVLRVFGENNDLGVLSSRITREFSQKGVILLTTNDFARVDELEDLGYEVMTATQIDTETAKNSSGKFLNHAFLRLREQGYKYVWSIASGFERTWAFIAFSAGAIMEEYPDYDVYFCMTQGIHHLPEEYINRPGRTIVKEEGIRVLLEEPANRGIFFPSESNAIINLKTVGYLDEYLSEKGQLGYIVGNEIPLGGIELMLTIIKKYAETGFIPRMIGFQSSLDRYMFKNHTAPPIEVTSSDIKRIRRMPTINAALRYYGLSLHDYYNIFSHTKLLL